MKGDKGLDADFVYYFASVDNFHGSVTRSHQLLVGYDSKTIVYGRRQILNA